jgi:hypothetical protein
MERESVCVCDLQFFFIKFKFMAELGSYRHSHLLDHLISHKTSTMEKGNCIFNLSV